MTAPAWVSVNSITGQLTITSPSVLADTTVSFYINSVISGDRGTIQKIVTVNLLDCIVANCQECLCSSGSTWATCNSGYTLTSGSWIAPVATPAAPATPASTPASSSSGATQGSTKNQNSNSTTKIDDDANTEKNLIDYSCIDNCSLRRSVNSIYIDKYLLPLADYKSSSNSILAASDSIIYSWPCKDTDHWT